MNESGLWRRFPSSGVVDVVTWRRRSIHRPMRGYAPFPSIPFFFSFFWWRKATFIWTNERPAENPRFINSKSSWLLEWIDPADWISVVDVLTWLFCLVSCLSLSVVGAGATFYPFLSFSPHSSSCSLSLFSPRPLAVLRPSPLPFTLLPVLISMILKHPKASQSIPKHP